MVRKRIHMDRVGWGTLRRVNVMVIWLVVVNVMVSRAAMSVSIEAMVVSMVRVMWLVKVEIVRHR